MSRILVVGCGYVGSALGAILARDGHKVWGVCRSTHTLPGGIQGIDADILDPTLATILPPEVNQVFYVVGASHFAEGAYRATYIHGLENLLEALQAQSASCERIFFTSSTGVYAQDQGEWVDEDSSTTPARFSGKVLLEAEALLTGAPVASIVVRLGGIYGPGRSRLLDEVRSGAARRIESGNRYLNLIHRDDCAGALRHLMRFPTLNSLYIAVDNEPIKFNTLLTWCAERLGKEKPPIISTADAPAPPRDSNKRCCNARLLTTGYRFQYPTYREGYKTLL